MADEPQHGTDAKTEGDGTLARLKAARAAGAVFGETPIQISEPVKPEPDEEPDEGEDSPTLEPRVRNAAMAASLKTGALACVAAVFMGFVLFCSLGSLVGGGYSVGLGLLVMLLGAPAAVIAGISSYRQTLETERHKVGLCPRCGYDLRGSMGLRCPECGWRIVTPGQTKAPWTEEEQRARDME